MTTIREQEMVAAHKHGRAVAVAHHNAGLSNRQPITRLGRQIYRTEHEVEAYAAGYIQERRRQATKEAL